MSKFSDEFVEIVRSGGQAVLCETYMQDHERCVKEIRRIMDTEEKLKQYKAKIVVWTPSHGFEGVKDGKMAANITVAFEWITSQIGPDNPFKAKHCIFVFKWVSETLNKSEAGRAFLCELVASNQFNRQDACRPIVILHSSTEPILNLQVHSHTQKVEFPPPDAASLRQILDDTVTRANRSRQEANRKQFGPVPEDRLVRMSRAMLGLDEKAATDYTSRLAVRFATQEAAEAGQTLFPEEAVQILQERKDDLIRQATALRPVPWDHIPQIDQVADMDQFIPWLQDRALGFLPENVKYNVSKLKFVIVTGVAGCGKSEVCKTSSRIFNKRLYRLDWGALKKGVVGASEMALRETLSTIEAINEGVVWLDEMEKLFAGSQSSQDAGVQRSLLGYFLHWMDNFRADVVIVATCNSFQDLPIELRRRANQIWGVGLPSPDGRWEILKIHCKKRGIDISNFEPEKERILRETDKFTGFDLVKGLDEAHFYSLKNPEPGTRSNARLVKGQPSIDQLLAGLKSNRSTFDTDPQAVTEQIRLALLNAKPVSKHMEAEAARLKADEGGEERPARSRAGRRTDAS